MRTVVPETSAASAVWRERRRLRQSGEGFEEHPQVLQRHRGNGLLVGGSCHRAPRETKKLPERGPQKRKQENPFWAKRMAEEARHANKIDADTLTALAAAREKMLSVDIDTDRFDDRKRQRAADRAAEEASESARSKKSKGSKNRALDNRLGKSSADMGMNTTEGKCKEHARTPEHIVRGLTD
ncbi:hypothetical protein FIBSPDRAFT_903793 [Athelia psychrophila]|uniref:Uncharacterized protein n=1 Tax=Athelia psychrophila TaxID=1759441 RepID=A0A167VJ16_9AGAM|nr:hypothetical protein FIBSPDRAFT_903793 [Fibularhizoctonia sp. CBS 109695]